MSARLEGRSVQKDEPLRAEWLRGRLREIGGDRRDIARQGWPGGVDHTPATALGSGQTSDHPHHGKVWKGGDLAFSGDVNFFESSGVQRQFGIADWESVFVKQVRDDIELRLVILDGLKAGRHRVADLQEQPIDALAAPIGEEG